MELPANESKLHFCISPGIPVQEHKLGEVGNKTTFSSQYTLLIFLPKITKIGQCLTKLQLMKDVGVF